MKKPRNNDKKGFVSAFNFLNRVSGSSVAVEKRDKDVEKAIEEAQLKLVFALIH